MSHTQTHPTRRSRPPHPVDADLRARVAALEARLAAIEAGLLFDAAIDADDELTTHELALLSEPVLARDWLTPEEQIPFGT